MDRRTFIERVMGGLLAAPLAAEAQQAGKIARIGYLSPNVATANPRLLEPFRQGMRDLGYVEGRNLLIEYRFAEGKLEQLPTLAANLVALKVDVIVTAGGTLAALAAQQATKTLPIVIISVADPVTDGLVTSLMDTSIGAILLEEVFDGVHSVQHESFFETLPKGSKR